MPRRAKAEQIDPENVTEITVEEAERDLHSKHQAMIAAVRMLPKREVNLTRAVAASIHSGISEAARDYVEAYLMYDKLAK